MTRKARQVDRWMNEAVQLHKHGQLDEAAAIYGKVLRKEKRNPDATHLLGLIAYARGQLTIAATMVRKAIAYRPHDAEFHYNLGNVEKAAGNLVAAVKAYNASIEHRPHDFRVYSNLGNVVLDLGRADEAIECYRKAIDLNPRDVLALANLGYALGLLERWSESYAVLQEALGISPGQVSVLVNLALVSCGMEDYSSATDYNSRALAIDAHNYKSQVVRGYLEMVNGRLTAAKHIFQTLAGPIESGYDEAHEYLAQMAFYEGDLATGFDHYRSRYQPRFTDLPRLTEPPQKSQKPLLVREQGIGDQIRYARFYGFLSEDGVAATVTCDPRLLPLLQRSFPSLKFLADTTKNHVRLSDDFSHETAIASLGMFYQHRLSAEPSGYLIPDHAKVCEWRRWRQKLPTSATVGLAWRGAKQAAGRERWYPPLTELLSLISAAGMSVVSLQHGITDEERHQFSEHGVSLLEPDELDLRDDQDGLAALLASLDLVIVPASAISELAAAVGVKTWLMAKKDYKLWWLSAPYMRHFHPSIKLFLREQSDPDWGVCLEQLATQLSTFACSSTTFQDCP